MTYRPSAARSLPYGGPEGLSYVQTGKLREHSTAEAIYIYIYVLHNRASFARGRARPEGFS
jgi:hypothetical protein